MSLIQSKRNRNKAEMSSLICTNERGRCLMTTTLQRPQAETLSLIVVLLEDISLYRLLMSFVVRFVGMFVFAQDCATYTMDWTIKELENRRLATQRYRQRKRDRDLALLEDNERVSCIPLVLFFSQHATQMKEENNELKSQGQAVSEVQAYDKVRLLCPTAIFFSHNRRHRYKRKTTSLRT